MSLSDALSAKTIVNKRLSGRFLFIPIKEPIIFMSAWFARWFDYSDKLGYLKAIPVTVPPTPT